MARRAFSLLRGFGVSAEIRTYRRQAFGRETRYELHLGEDPRAVQVLNEAGVVDAGLAPLEQPPRRLVARSCCRAGYLRGALLAAGSVSGPHAPHLELRTATRTGAERLAALAAEDGIALAVVERPRHAAAYARGRDAIAELLGLVGAHDAALSLEETGVIGATRARANRLANADHANLVRASRCSAGRARGHPPARGAGRPRRSLAGPARDRRASPSLPTLSLRELAGRFSRPTTKATVHRRLKRLERLAAE